MFRLSTTAGWRLVAAALLMTCLQTQAGEMTGQVTFSGKGMPGATIALSGNGNHSAVSGKDGLYAITVPNGTYDLKVAFSGFKAIVDTVSIGDTSLQRDFALEAAQYEELTVISTSKVETRIIDAPATVSVVTSADLENSVADDFGDVLRELPGVNVVQFSARDINVVTREESASLANSQLTLLDGRTIYLDFFGIVLWDLVPTNMNEIKQIEVIRGPASAIWGANAQTGLVNIITKSPREMIGTTLTLNASTFGRDYNNNGLSDGSSYGFDITHAGIVDDTWSYKVSAGYFDSDPWARPTGIVPADPERGTGGFPYPNFENSPTEQPKVDFRLDQEINNGRVTYQVGYAGTEGIIHSGIGPFDIQNGTRFSYGKVNYSKGALKINFFANLLDGDATNVLTAGPDGNPIEFSFKTDTYDIEVGHSAYVGDNHLFSYGANIRKNDFELSLAPGEDSRDQWGAYVQDEMTFGKFRAVLGVRLDKFESIDDVIPSPRVALMYQPSDQHTFRISYNEAFRAPSLIENYLDVNIVAAELDLGLIDPSLAGVIFPIITNAHGNRDLVEDALTAYEIGYTGVFEKGVFSLAWYRNDTDDNMNFLNPPGAVYNSQNPAPGWPLPPQVLDILLSQGIGFPSEFTYQNLGPVRYQGLEAGLDFRINDTWSGSVNAAWQDDPEIEASPNPFPAEELSPPPSYRYHGSISYDGGQLFGKLGINNQDDFFSTDVLDSRFHGRVDSYTMVNFNLGYRFMDNRVNANLKVTNLTDEDIQEHIFADIMKRNIAAELKINF